MVTRELIKVELGNLITEAMYMDDGELVDDQLFSDFGLESTTLVKIVGKLSEKYNCEISAKELLPHQTLNDASVFICEKINAENAETVLEVGNA